MRRLSLRGTPRQRLFTAVDLSQRGVIAAVIALAKRSWLPCVTLLLKSLAFTGCGLQLF